MEATFKEVVKVVTLADLGIQTSGFFGRETGETPPKSQGSCLVPDFFDLNRHIADQVKTGVSRPQLMTVFGANDQVRRPLATVRVR